MLGRVQNYLLLLMAGLVSSLSFGHEVPADVELKIFLKPQAQTLTVLVRVPLEAMRDFEFAQRGAGYLDLVAVEPQLKDAVRLWLVHDLALFEADRRLAPPTIEAVRLALPSDSAFDDYRGALEALRSIRLPETTDLPWRQALLETQLSYRIDSDQSGFYLEPTLARLGLRTAVQVRLLREGAGGVLQERALAFVGDPGRISLEPGWAEVLGRFLSEGFGHVQDGADHLLFLFALVIPLWHWRPLLAVITAFTLAHSLTLAAALLGLVPSVLWFPALVEVLIAASIVLMALENLFASDLHRRWLIAFAFGLVHGFGFSFALGETLQFAGDHPLVSLLGFNLGVELGQLLVLGVLIPVLLLAGRYLPRRMLVIVLSVVVAHSGWHWLLERWSTLDAYTFVRPEFDLVLLAGGMRWLMLLLCAGLVAWLLRGVFDRLSTAPSAQE